MTHTNDMTPGCSSCTGYSRGGLAVLYLASRRHVILHNGSQELKMIYINHNGEQKGLCYRRKLSLTLLTKQLPSAKSNLVLKIECQAST